MGEETLPKYPGLFARDNGVFYVRKRVPNDLIAVEKRASLRFSLETADRRIAIKRYPFKLAEIEAHFDGLRNRLQSMGAVDRALAAGKLERLQERQIEAIVSDWWRRREIAREPVLESPDEIDGLVAAAEDDTHQSCAGLSDEAVRSTADRLLVEAGMPGRPHRVGKLTTSLLYPVVDRNTHSYRYLCELVSRGLVAETALTRDRLLSNHETPFDPLFNPNGARKAEAGGSGYRLSDLFRDYAAERATRYGRHSTEKRYGFVFRIMDEVLGRDRLMSSLTRADLVSVLAFVQRLPPNPTKRFPTLTLTEIVEKADAEALPRLAPNSVSTYMQALAAALRWAKEAGWEVNVASRDLVGSRRAMIKRRGFRPDELSALFATLIAYRTLEPAKFWVPALALYTGARAGELCQLRVEVTSSLFFHPS